MMAKKPNVFRVLRGSDLELPNNELWARAGQYVEVPNDALRDMIDGQQHKLAPATKEELERGVRTVGLPADYANEVQARGFKPTHDRMIRTRGPRKKVKTK